MLVYEASFCRGKVARLWEVGSWDEDVGEEGGAEVDAFRRGGGDTSVKDFVAERAKDYEAELNVHVYESSAVADEAFRGKDQVIHTNA